MHSPDHSGYQPFRPTRREFLQSAAAAGGALLLFDPLSATEFGAQLPTWRFKVRRPVDLIDLDISFVNFERRGSQLVALGAGQSLVIVRFPPQNLAEAIFDETVADEHFEYAPLPQPPDKPQGTAHANSPTPPIRSFLSGPSWLVFVSPDQLSFPLLHDQGQRVSESVVDSWLRTMADWKLKVPAAAVSPDGTVSKPRWGESILEVPFRLFIAPSNDQTRWLTSSERLWGVDNMSPAAQELWHASLLSRIPLQPAKPSVDFKNLTPELQAPTRIMAQARAVFSPDYAADGKTPTLSEYYPGNLPLSIHKLTRHQLVKQQMCEKDGWIDIEHLVLSALGCDASFSYSSNKRFNQIICQQLAKQLNGDIDDETQLGIWKHRIVVGRDAFFIEAYFGFLFPFVYPSLAIELTQRKFAAYYPKNGGPKDDELHSAPGAYLLKERFILVQDPVQRFPDSGSTVGRKMPLKRATLLNTRSPLLANWGQFPIRCDCDSGEFSKLGAGVASAVADRLHFIPRLLENADNPGTDGVRWSMEFEDEAGQKARTSNACLLFAQNVVLGRQLWQALQPRFTAWRMPAQKIAFAPNRSELTLVARWPRQVKEKGEAAVGQTFFSYELVDEERRAARFLGQILRAAAEINVGGTSYKQIKDWAQSANDDVSKFTNIVTSYVQDHKNQLTVDVQQVRSAISLLRAETLKALHECASAIAAVEGEAEEHYEDFLRQLERAEQVGSTLETHLLKFDCGQVNQLFDAVDGKIAEFAQQAAKVDDFVAQVKGLNLGEVGNAEQRWVDRIVNEVNARTKSLQDEAAKVRELQAYIKELGNAATQAKELGNQFFHAQLAEAEVAIEALRNAATDVPLCAIDLFDEYLAKGMGKLGEGLSRVQNGVFATLQQAINQGSAMADSARCAVAKPAAIIAGLSRDLGALSGQGADAISKIANQICKKPELQPTLDDLKNAIPDAKLFSVLPLRDIVGLINNAPPLTSKQLPTIHSLTLPDHIERTWEWTSPVNSQDFFGILKFKVGPGLNEGSVNLHISAVTRIDLPKVDPKALAADGAPANMQDLHGQMTVTGFLGYWDAKAKKAAKNVGKRPAFDLVILDMIDVPFESVEFSAKGPVGQSLSTKVVPHVGQVQFLGPLKFIKAFEDALSSLLGDPFTLTVTPEFVKAGFHAGLPPISFGVVSIANIAVGAGLTLSFTDKPLLFDFNFASKEKMFTVSVLCFGGRGFFRLSLATDGNRDIEGSLEFGGILEFNVAVASGSLSLTAGFHFRITNSTTDLSGYIQAGGNLNVLGLIHASVQFLLAGRYRMEKHDGVIDHLIYGICTISVSIDLFMLSFSVSITMEKRIAGSSEPDHQTALRVNHNPFRLASMRSSAAVSRGGPARAYFARPDREVPGRFDYPPTSAGDEKRKESISCWDNAYWSQFHEAVHRTGEEKSPQPMHPRSRPSRPTRRRR